MDTRSLKPSKQREPQAPPLAPRAWKPVLVRLDIDRLFELHPDGKVYERRRKEVLRSPIHLPDPKHSPTVRRVKDRKLVDRVQQAFRQQVEQRKSLQGRAAGIVDQVMGGGKV